MATIKFDLTEEAVWAKFASQGGHVDPDEGEKRPIFGGPSELELFEIRLNPNHENESHAHVEDEILYVLEGSLIFGRRELRAGSAVLIPGSTLYSFKTGENGARFLNFRPRKAERVVIWKDELLAERKAQAI
jgi:quercetin dioxygenase-like cupin family protein